MMPAPGFDLVLRPSIVNGQPASPGGWSHQKYDRLKKQSLFVQDTGCWTLTRLKSVT